MPPVPRSTPSMPTVALFANPGSGGGAEPADVADELARHGADVRLVDQLDGLGSAAAGADRVAVAGGNGSVGPAAVAAAEAGRPLAVIPTGTANDFARAMALPAELEQACRLAVRGEELRALDLCRMNGRPFVNAANAGLAAAAGRSAVPLKPVLGSLAYAVGALQAGATAQPVSCRVECAGELLYEGRVWQVVVAGSGSFGAGARIEAADPSDGLLDVAVIEAGSRLALVRHAYGLRSGGLARQPGVHQARGATAAVQGRAGFNVDGELLAAVPSARFVVEPGAFRLVTG